MRNLIKKFCEKTFSPLPFSLCSKHPIQKPFMQDESTTCEMQEKRKLFFWKDFSLEYFFVILSMFQAPNQKCVTTKYVNSLQIGKIKQLIFSNFFSQNYFAHFLHLPSTMSKNDTRQFRQELADSKKKEKSTPFFLGRPLDPTEKSLIFPRKGLWISPKCLTCNHRARRRIRLLSIVLWQLKILKVVCRISIFFLPSLYKSCILEFFYSRDASFTERAQI